MITARIDISDWQFSGKDFKRFIKHAKSINDKNMLTGKSIYGELTLTVKIHDILPTSYGSEKQSSEFSGEKTTVEFSSSPPVITKAVYKRPKFKTIEADKIGPGDMLLALTRAVDQMQKTSLQLASKSFKNETPRAVLEKAIKEAEDVIAKYRKDHFK